MRFTKKRLWITAAIVLLLALMVFANLRRRQKGATEVEAQTVEERELRAVVSASGKIRPKVSVDISASTTGKVYRLGVEEGDVVEKGQFLLQIDPTPAEANVQQIEASIAAARARLELERANLEQAESELRREEALREGNLTSEQAVENARTSYRVQKMAVQSTEQEIVRLQAMLRNARHELSKVNVHADISGVVTKLNIEEGENVFVGAFNNPATVLLTVADLSVIEAEVEVDETDVVNVQIGQEAEVNVDAYPDTTFSGYVTKVGHSPILSVSGGVQQEATSFQVIVQLTDIIPNVRPGLSCKADITTGYRDKAIAVPIQALTLRKPSELQPLEATNEEGSQLTNGAPAASHEEDEEEEIQGAFVIEDEKAYFRAVQSGIAGERHFEVLSGLKPGDRVVTGPFKALRRLRNGDLVRIKEKPEER